MMRQTNISLNFAAVTLLIVLAIASRLIPHPANFAPMMSIGIFGGAVFMQKRWAYIIPIAAIWISDLLMNNILYAAYYDHFVWFYSGWYWQYAMYLFIPFLSVLLFKNDITFGKVTGMSVAGAVLFFIVSNFGTWAGGMLYPMTVDGLISCYIMALPYFKGSLMGNLFYSGVLFGLYYLIEQRSPALSVTSKFSKRWI